MSNNLDTTELANELERISNEENLGEYNSTLLKQVSNILKSGINNRIETVDDTRTKFYDFCGKHVCNTCPVCTNMTSDCNIFIPECFWKWLKTNDEL